MKIAFPCNENMGMDSQVFNHFGTAKIFVVVETESNNVEIIENQDLNHKHNMCQPLKALGDIKVDAVAVGGIGGGALKKLKASGIKVFKSEKGSVKDCLNQIKAGTILEFNPIHICSGHDHKGGCGLHK
ncbi:Dinitrogenase iron-molybdenum cofactor domain-containing protein [Desulfonema limicola]|uniref:Dinitrogenase iron-molybdenum cofactor domain-containing protein n=1 Tax=Desulfonema limicola TaxID=45656 RepID=A0A975BA01_9BACT|nr:NifB/NifX family molybdenum-iron cluster-binding protein [Desulfonema limicola]QTA81275.1 Dinitrogenase iron-molybdenum cofactor domain-containing protein [Desulfonema limicola]